MSGKQPPSDYQMAAYYDAWREEYCRALRLVRSAERDPFMPRAIRNRVLSDYRREANALRLVRDTAREKWGAS